MKHRRSFTTDDIPHDASNNINLDDIETGTSCDKIKLINLLTKQYGLIEECNRIICQEATKFILANKPVFDAEKLKLYKLENLKTQLINIGMREIYSIEHIVIDNGYVLNENTFSKCWNDNAKKINALVNKCVDTNNRNYTANAIITMKYKTAELAKTRKCIYILYIFSALLILTGVYCRYNNLRFMHINNA